MTSFKPPHQHSAAVVVENLTVQRGGKPVLNDLNFTIGAGSITGLLGPSGSGKTTLIRAIVGVQTIQSGSVTVLGHPAGAPPLRRLLGYVTQDPSVYLDLSVRENVRYFAALYGLGADAADAAIGDVGLAESADQLTGDLSGGQSSRVSLACAQVGKPTILVLDEPTVGQDPLLREELWTRFRAAADGGTTVIVSSHVMDEANRCDRLLLIRQGSLIADGSPAAILQEAGTTSMDQAFLNLVRRGAAAEATAASPAHRPPNPTPSADRTRR